MKRQELKFIFGIMALVSIIGYACFGETDVLTAKALSGLGLLVGLWLMGSQSSSRQKQ